MTFLVWLYRSCHVYNMHSFHVFMRVTPTISRACVVMFTGDNSTRGLIMNHDVIHRISFTVIYI